MIKIIGGEYRSRIIDTPDSKTTLPTKNMVRGAMLSSLGQTIYGANVLDLFAGSGALGIECLSRGAKKATFVEKDRAAYQIVVGNLAKLKETNGVVLNLDYQTALSRLEGQCFDIVFLDPPYAMKDAYQYAVSYLKDHKMIGPSSYLILEYEGDLPFEENDFSLAKHYHYGKTNVLLLQGVKQ